LCPGDLGKTFDENLLAVKGYNDSHNLVRLVIPKERRVEYLRQLDNMNINRTSLFPGLEGFASSLGVYHHLYDRHILSKSPYASQKGSSVWEDEKKEKKRPSR